MRVEICAKMDLKLADFFSKRACSRTNFVALSKHFEKIITSPSKQLLSALFIDLNESSHQELFNQSIYFEKFKMFQKLSWKN